MKSTATLILASEDENQCYVFLFKNQLADIDMKEISRGTPANSSTFKCITLIIHGSSMIGGNHHVTPKMDGSIAAWLLRLVVVWTNKIFIVSKHLCFTHYNSIQYSWNGRNGKFLKLFCNLKSNIKTHTVIYSIKYWYVEVIIFKIRKDEERRTIDS